MGTKLSIALVLSRIKEPNKFVIKLLGSFVEVPGGFEPP